MEFMNSQERANHITEIDQEIKNNIEVLKSASSTTADRIKAEKRASELISELNRIFGVTAEN